MRFIQNLSPETIQLLQRIYQSSKHHRVRQRGQCILLSYKGYMINELAQTFNQEQKEQMREWIKLYPKNLNKVIELIKQEFNLSTSRSTLKRIMKSLKMTWRRIRKKVKGQPDLDIYQERKEALEILIEEDKEGVIDLRYYDESGFCLVPYIPYAW